MPRLVLAGPRRLELQPLPPPGASDDRCFLVVKACGLCRTDAKMWAQGEAGQPDLRLPRVLGHECTGVLDGQRFAVWPGESCGACDACRRGSENLCRSMRILGFHEDGGLATRVAVRRENLIAIPASLSFETATLAEPLGCALHALQLANAKSGSRVFVAGGGTLGVLLGLAAAHRGLTPTLWEPNPEKRTRLRATWHDLLRVPDSLEENDFDLAINACSHPTALAECLARLGPGGVAVHFSGLSGPLEQTTLNLLHYHELCIVGSYGCTRADLRAALDLMASAPASYEVLLERVLDLGAVESVMEEVLSGNSYRIVCRITE